MHEKEKFYFFFFFLYINDKKNCSKWKIAVKMNSSYVGKLDERLFIFITLRLILSRKCINTNVYMKFFYFERKNNNKNKFHFILATGETFYFCFWSEGFILAEYDSLKSSLFWVVGWNEVGGVCEEWENYLKY